jgi:MoaA/NifB/PqqE/SkfB family radical SAM enzyme
MVDAAPDKSSADLKTVRQFIKFADKLGVRFLGISGGEPLEHPQFFKVMEMLLQKNKRTVVLMTNGRCLEDEKLTARLAKLQRKHFFGIQVSAIPGLYPHAAKTAAAFKRQCGQFADSGIHLIEKLTVMTRLGRAAGKDWSHLGPLFERKVTNCFNLIFNATRFDSLAHMVRAFETQTEFNFCKPMVDPQGGVHVGESPHCSRIGDIWEPNDTLHERLKEVGFCGACGDPIPPMLAHLKRGKGGK